MLQYKKYYFKKNLPDDLITDDDIKFPKQPDYKPFPTQPTYKPFPAAPDYSKAAAEMGLLASSAGIALPLIEGIVKALEKLSAGFGIGSLLTGLAGLIAGKLLGNFKMGVEIDRKDYDAFKKEVQSWIDSKSTKIIDIETDDKGLDNANLDISGWVNDKQTKTIKIDVDLSGLQSAYIEAMSWVNSKTTKH